MKDRKFVVYELRFPGGFIYIGRTGTSLAERMEQHHEAARGNKKGGIRLAWCLLKWPDTKPIVVWQGANYYQSMGREIAAIKVAKHRHGICLLNRTRGGFYDPYDAGLSTPKRRRRS